MFLIDKTKIITINKTVFFRYCTDICFCVLKELTNFNGALYETNTVRKEQNLEQVYECAFRKKNTSVYVDYWFIIHTIYNLKSDCY